MDWFQKNHWKENKNVLSETFWFCESEGFYKEKKTKVVEPWKYKKQILIHTLKCFPNFASREHDNDKFSWSIWEIYKLYLSE